MLRCAEGNLLKRAFRQDITALECLPAAACQADRRGNGSGQRRATVSTIPSTTPHPRPHLAPSRRLPLPQNQSLANYQPQPSPDPGRPGHSKPMIFKRFRLNSRNRKIDDLYGAIVAQSRSFTPPTASLIPWMGALT